MILLCELLKNWPCTAEGGDIRTEIHAVTDHSAEVVPGSLFVARKGRASDGAAHIPEALRKGAVAVVTDSASPPVLPPGVVSVSVPDAADFLAHACSAFFGRPSERLSVIAVTGTNGKTTVTRFIGQIFKEAGVKAAVLGTLGLWIDGEQADYPLPPMTTVPPAHLHKVLRHCVDAGVTHVALEASSLGLEGGRLNHCRIRDGIFLNIGNDHHGEHGGEAAYLRAKARLVKLADQIIVNRDDPAVLKLCEGAIPAWTFGGTPGDGRHVWIADDGSGGWEAGWCGGGAAVDAPVGGEHNRLNAAAALAAALSAGLEPAGCAGALGRLRLPAGRMQEMEKNGIRVVVDYAHTPDALEAVLKALSRTATGRLITVFGCGGDRDKEKRPEMGEIAAFYSSEVWVTSDNPRNEDPEAIIRDIFKGIGRQTARFRKEPDRDRAIRYAIAGATPGDVVLIAGKGHESGQTAGGVTKPFSDAEAAERHLSHYHGNHLEISGADPVQSVEGICYDGGEME
ncbi:UDP-N-acetylmuramoyl-L-alanyl-D-glutamate--2,6-diaminopimelate ligase [Bhargavaea ullalensis]|uniref:UDP-N-acetylmuramoyl-L-alanyl-D-glutamate--2,6-diaminopimelate ligase n=1 Tax=Bhargavaea ullalensis TaxID=1265685 RepID=A0ABV2GC31_9BACL